MKNCLVLVLVLVLVLGASACGSKGDPLPPFRPVPEKPANLLVIRVPDAPITLRFELPKASADGTALNLAALEIYSVMRPSTGRAPEPTDIGGRGNLVARIDLKEPPEPGSAFVWEDSSADAMTPAPLVVRYYAVMGVSGHNRRGAPSDVVGVPLGEFPPTPSKLSASTTETAIKLDWLSTAPGVGYRVFEVKDGKPAVRPLNDTLLTATTFEDARMAFGVERCYQVRAVRDPSLVSLSAPGVTSAASIESRPSNTVCVTPSDVFPPPAPANLTAIAGTGVINLIWDGVDVPDLAGYLVLRAEAPGDKLLPLDVFTPLFAAPILDTTYKDATAKTGTRYVYVVVAVDKATPPNRSKESNRVEETGR